MMERGLISDQACTPIKEYLSISSSNSESEDSNTE